MRKQVKDKGRNSSKKARRVTAVAIAIAVLALGTMAAVSLRSQAKDTNSPQANAATHANLPLKTQPAPFVMQTAQIKPLTQEEAQKLAAALKELVNQSTDGLQQVRHADGSVSMDLQGHFQNIAVAKLDADGKLVESCIDNPGAAAEFFGIDPQLVGVKTAAGATTNSSTQSKGEVR